MTLATADIDYVRDIVRERSAIVIDASKTYLIESRLAPIMRQTGIASLSELVAKLRRDASGQLQDLVVDAMTTNETTFFRDVGLWTELERSLLPQLIAARQTERSINFWSAACSSGPEPYSIAMLLLDRFPAIAQTWNVRIIATDLSAEMLGRAAAGRYTQLEVNRGLPAPSLVKHFKRDGAFWQIDDRIRSMVEFRSMNLAKPWGFIPQIDLLFMRNVLIYFDMDSKREILGRCRSALRPDGHLILGTAETTLNIDDRFRRNVVGGATTYLP
jgi:chemotaxis protein methyltransferase CheR